MRNRKSGFLTFIFSFIPGAGEMYMGFFKQGLSLMSAFILVCIVATFLGIDTLMLFLPLIWFYSFFHVHHLRSLPPEEFYEVEDKFLFGEGCNLDMHGFLQKYSKVVAIILIVIGAMILWNVVLDKLYWILPDYMNGFVSILRNLLPRVIVGILIIIIGMKMLRGTKPAQIEEKDNEEE